jgi:hypothetical protein
MLDRIRSPTIDANVARGIPVGVPFAATCSPLIAGHGSSTVSDVPPHSPEEPGRPIVDIIRDGGVQPGLNTSVRVGADSAGYLITSWNL